MTSEPKGRRRTFADVKKARPDFKVIPPAELIARIDAVLKDWRDWKDSNHR
jgi:hypothetical protein